MKKDSSVRLGKSSQISQRKKMLLTKSELRRKSVSSTEREREREGWRRRGREEEEGDKKGEEARSRKKARVWNEEGGEGKRSEMHLYLVIQVISINFGIFGEYQNAYK